MTRPWGYSLLAPDDSPLFSMTTRARPNGGEAFVSDMSGAHVHVMWEYQQGVLRSAGRIKAADGQHLTAHPEFSSALPVLARLGVERDPATGAYRGQIIDAAPGSTVSTLPVWARTVARREPHRLPGPLVDVVVVASSAESSSIVRLAYAEGSPAVIGIRASA